MRLRGCILGFMVVSATAGYFAWMLYAPSTFALHGSGLHEATLVWPNELVCVSLRGFKRLAHADVIESVSLSNGTIAALSNGQIIKLGPDGGVTRTPVKGRFISVLPAEGERWLWLSSRGENKFTVGCGADVLLTLDERLSSPKLVGVDGSSVLIVSGAWLAKVDSDGSTNWVDSIDRAAAERILSRHGVAALGIYRGVRFVSPEWFVVSYAKGAGADDVFVVKRDGSGVVECRKMPSGAASSLLLVTNTHGTCDKMAAALR